MSKHSILKQQSRLTTNPKPYQKNNYTEQEKSLLKNNYKRRPVKIFFPMNKQLIESLTKQKPRAKDLIAKELTARYFDNK